MSVWRNHRRFSLDCKVQINSDQVSRHSRNLLQRLVFERINSTFLPRAHARKCGDLNSEALSQRIASPLDRSAAIFCSVIRRFTYRWLDSATSISSQIRRWLTRNLLRGQRTSALCSTRSSGFFSLTAFSIFLSRPQIRYQFLRQKSIRFRCDKSEGQ